MVKKCAALCIHEWGFNSSIWKSSVPLATRLTKTSHLIKRIQCDTVSALKKKAYFENEQGVLHQFAQLYLLCTENTGEKPKVGEILRDAAGSRQHLANLD